MRETGTYDRFFDLSFLQVEEGFPLKRDGEASDLLTHKHVHNPTEKARNERKRHAGDQREKFVANLPRRQAHRVLSLFV